MKHLFLKKAVLAALAAILLPFVVSCSDEDEIIDYAPVSFSFEIVDASGNNLLNPESDGYFGKNLSFEYNGKIYDCEWDGPSMYQSRYYMPMFCGFYFNYPAYKSSGECKLGFGELDGAFDYDMDMALIEPDGTRHIIHYYRKVNKMKVKETITFDGKAIKDRASIRLVK